MLSVERKNSIMEYLLIHKTASVSTLSEMHHVTETTIRRDLRKMEAEGSIVRTHGGAFIPKKATNAIAADTRSKVHQSSKVFIAKECAKLICEKDTLFLDSSTTATCLVNEILDKELTIITNSLIVANILMSHENIHLVLLGGDYEPNMCAFCSPLTTEMLKRYYVDKAFFSCRSIDLNSGLTDIHESICNLRHAAILHSNFSYCIADYSKFGHTSYLKLCELSEVCALITDYQFNSTWKKILNENNIWYLGKNKTPPGIHKPY